MSWQYIVANQWRVVPKSMHYFGMPIQSHEQASKDYWSEVEALGFPDIQKKYDWEVLYYVSEKSGHGSAILICIDPDNPTINGKRVAFDLWVQEKRKPATENEKEGPPLLTIVPHCRTPNPSHVYTDSHRIGFIQQWSLKELGEKAFARCLSLKRFIIHSGPNCHTFIARFIFIDLGMKRNIKKEVKRKSTIAYLTLSQAFEGIRLPKGDCC